MRIVQDGTRSTLGAGDKRPMMTWPHLVIVGVVTSARIVLLPDAIIDQGAKMLGIEGLFNSLVRNLVEKRPCGGRERTAGEKDDSIRELRGMTV